MIIIIISFSNSHLILSTTEQPTKPLKYLNNLNLPEVMDLNPFLAFVILQNKRVN